MRVQKFSKQRNAIMEYLINTKEHPTADTIYAHMREEIPNISLGTVYRNLHLLVDNGEIQKLTSKDGKDRFDAKTSDHYHFICNTCGKVEDLMIDPLIDINLINKFNNHIKITSHEINFSGLCEECLNKE